MVKRLETGRFLAKPKRVGKMAQASVVACLVTCMSAQVTYAKPASYSIGVDSRLSDNPLQSKDGSDADLETRINFRIIKESDPGRCTGSIAANLGYGRWLDESFDPETYINSDLFGQCELAKRLRWELSNLTRDVIQDSRGGTNQGNTTRKNVFRTGPRYVLNLSPRDLLGFTADYENTEYDEPDETDSDRVVGSVYWNHLFSVTFTGGLRAETNMADFDDGQEIDRETISGTFSKQWATSDLAGSIGVSTIETSFGGGSQSNDAVVWDITYTHEINSTADFFVSGNHQLTDQTSDFDIIINEFVFSTRENEAIEVNAFRAGLNKVFSAGDSINFYFFYDRSEYLISENDEDTIGLDVAYSRPITPYTDGTLGTQLNYSTYSEDGSEDTNLFLNAGMVHRFSSHLTGNARVGTEVKRSDVSNREYIENWVLVGLDYQFH